jgi:branched-chain amino acid transport system substrate-binding protein
LKSDSDGKAVAAKMKEMPTDDRLFGRGTVRVDGRKIHDAYLVEVKEPEESKYAGESITFAPRSPLRKPSAHSKTVVARS